jgi:selenide, water dikinase
MLKKTHPLLLVGNATKDDAAVFDLGNGTALISTTDFFMPIVDDAFEFGQIAAANAISDVYAMGGKPLLAVGILGWPVDKLPAALAAKVLQGAQQICDTAGIPLAGGHSIDSPEPFFGLAVNGLVDKNNLKKNNTAQVGDYIYITKSIGTGILAKALKLNKISVAHKNELIKQLTTLNSIGYELGKLAVVTALTDITGFGLLGHLIELSEGSGLAAEIDYNKIPLLDGVKEYIGQMLIPDNTYRNWNTYEKKVEGIGAESLFTLCDPQTNGGLLFTINAHRIDEVEDLLKQNNIAFSCIGRMVDLSDIAEVVSIY